MEQTALKYGWKYNQTGQRSATVLNKKGDETLTILFTGSKYTFWDRAGRKILSGSDSPATGLETILTEYYFCKQIYKETKP